MNGESINAQFNNQQQRLQTTSRMLMNSGTAENESLTLLHLGVHTRRRTRRTTRKVKKCQNKAHDHVVYKVRFLEAH